MADEQEVAVRRYLEHRRRSRELARLLVALDRAAAEARPKPSRRARFSLAPR